MAPNQKKRKHIEISAPPVTMLKPLQGAQIEAVTRTYNDLRAAGVNSVVALPATVVAGDTSSGKSSVMCRLTGLPFPRGEGVVTKFATEVEMMPAPQEHIEVSIRPDKQRSSEEQASLQQFKRAISLDQFEETFTDVCGFMAQFGQRALYADVLHISLKGPTCAPLTVIDLPGLIHASTQRISDSARVLAERLAKDYGKEERTLVLPVISASNEIVNQAITRLTREADPDGSRTLGIVTKVDTVCGKAKDAQLLHILSNEEISLKLGWHALVNTIEENDDATDEEIRKAERSFFQKARFKKLDKEHTGIDALRSRVVKVVGQKLVDTLPQLHNDVATKLEQEQDDLEALGVPMKELNAQRKLLMKICSQYQELMQNEINNVRSNTTKPTSSDDITLRSAIEKLHNDFACAMRTAGGTSRFAGLGKSSTPEISNSNPYRSWIKRSHEVTRSRAVTWVTALQQQNSGSGTMGSANDQVVMQLFQELSQRWADLAYRHLDGLASLCKAKIHARVLTRDTSYADARAQKVEANWIHPHIDTELAKVKLIIDELEQDTILTPKTYDPRLQTLREQKVKDFWAPDGAYAARDATSEKTTAVTNLMAALAYYETDLEYWITAVVKQAAERFVRRVPQALSPESVLDLSAEEVGRVMTESADLREERAETEDRVKTLQFALSKLHAQIKCLM